MIRLRQTLWATSLALALALAPVVAGAQVPGPQQLGKNVANGYQGFGALFSHFVQLSGSGNWTVPAGVTRVLVIGCGGGGGGGGEGGAAATAAGGTAATTYSVIYAVTPGASLAYSVGAAGAGGLAGNNTGSNGGDTTFDALTFKGGLGGPGSASSNASAPSAGTLLTISDGMLLASGLIVISSRSSNGVAGSAGTGGNGGASNFGAGGRGALNSAGGNATGNCAGGAGAGDTTSTSHAGGNGSAGAIAVLD